MKIMRLKEVMDTTGLGRSYIYKLLGVVNRRSCRCQPLDRFRFQPQERRSHC